jgi:hypothetical protein
MVRDVINAKTLVVMSIIRRDLKSDQEIAFMVGRLVLIVLLRFDLSFYRSNPICE